jgi:hypothetical protein
VLIQLEGERVDLALELAETAGKPVPLLAERFGERHHGLDEAVLAVVGGSDVVHRWSSGTESHHGSKSGAGASGLRERVLGARGVSSA